jgi:hypothetical protein
MKYLSGCAVLLVLHPVFFYNVIMKAVMFMSLRFGHAPITRASYLYILCSPICITVICPQHNRSIYDTLHISNENDHLSLFNVRCSVYINDWIQNYFLESLLFTGQDNLKT